MVVVTWSVSGTGGGGDSGGLEPHDTAAEESLPLEDRVRLDTPPKKGES